ncbi:hypothetical protein CTA1_8590 [Colletotrichum tanaceti]|uniref:Uncharacterized protein n=1 Tax=Colletotrichum tanaceti TaxID=1306861 RepID=A0A4U6X977_9PEZI|nr:hypothetical protein CTA1_8590 [Colletotrichum tanaceti]
MLPGLCACTNAPQISPSYHARMRGRGASEPEGCWETRPSSSRTTLAKGSRHPEAWRQPFDTWLDQMSVGDPPRLRPDAPVHVKLEQSFLEHHSVRDDGDAFGNPGRV